MKISFEPDFKNQLLLNLKLSSLEIEQFHQLKEKFEETNEKENFFFITSSGSSKSQNESAKLLAIHREALLNSARRFNDYFHAQSQDHWGLVLPKFHVAGLGVLARAYRLQSQVFESAWVPKTIEKWISKNQIAFMSLVPAQVFDLVQSQIQKPASIKKIFVGAGSLNSTIRNEFLKLNWPLVETYGMTETCSMIAIKENDLGFKVMPNVQVQARINTESSSCLSIKCDSLAHSILQLKNNKIEIKQIQTNEWFQTEDLVRLIQVDDNTYIEFLGRQTEFIKILGEGVSLNELRDKLEILILKEKIDPHQIYLIAIDDLRLQNQLILIVEKSVEKNKIELILKSFNQMVRPYEKIQNHILIDHIPRTEMKKIKRDELKKLVLKELNRSSQ